MFRSWASAIVFLVLSCAVPPVSRPQNQEPPPAEQPAEQYFSGTVVSFSAEKLTVDRTILGTNSSSRSFVITSETQIDGKLRNKARVTVRYVTRDDVDHAIHIVVRNSDPKKQP